MVVHSGGVGGGWRRPLLWAALLLLLPAAHPAAHPAATRTSTTNHYTSINDIEAFVKKLEYEAVNGEAGPGEVAVVDLNLLPDDTIDQDLVDGLQEEFSSVDRELGDPVTRAANTTSSGPQSRQLSLIFQGVYAPDARFNAFVDGVMVNMVAEMKRKKMDPLYFRVYDRGIVEHVSTRAGRDGQPDQTLPPAAAVVNITALRDGRQSGTAIGGGVIRGLTNVKRFGNAEVQIAGNLTLVRSHYVYGPLNVELVFHTDKGVKTINSTLSAVAAHAVADMKDNSSKLIDFIIDSPAEYEVRLVGARSQRYQRISQSALMRLFKPTGRLERRLQRVYVRARSRRIPDVVARSHRRNNRRNGSTNKQASSGTKDGGPARNGQGDTSSNQKADGQEGAQKEHSQEPWQTRELP